tara:strand:+ start:102 stop:785 length:684 start_codon:yes stop_codon:yes gene_type:complete
MNYIEVLLKLNKSKKILFFIFFIFMACGYLLQKNASKTYEFYVDIYFPTGSFLSFEAKNEIYKNFRNSILTELTKQNFKIKQKPNLENSYRIFTTITGNNTADFLKKKKQITNLFKRQKGNLILWITNDYNIKSITLKDLDEGEISLDEIRKIKLELMWMGLEKEFVYENVTELNNLKFPKKLIVKNKTNYFAIMAVIFITFLTLFVTYLIISDDIKKKIKKIKKIK